MEYLNILCCERKKDGIPEYPLLKGRRMEYLNILCCEGRKDDLLEILPNLTMHFT